MPSARLARLTLPLLLILPVSSAQAKAAPKSANAQAPSFTLPTRDASVCSDSLLGHVVYVDFWASWCGPCKQSFPWMKTLHDKYAAKGLVIVAINLDKDRGAAETFLSKYPAPFQVAFDPSGKTAKAFHVWGMPTAYLVSPKGTILSTHQGYDPKRAAEVESQIASALTP